MTQITNIDAASICNRALIFREELKSSNSSANANMLEADKTRSAKNLEAMSKLVDFIKNKGEEDLPHTGGQRSYEAGETPAPEDVADIKNTDVKHICNRWALIHGEVVNSQSAKQASGLQAQDADRLLSMLAALTDYHEYVNDVEPLDLPETVGASAA